VLRFFLDAAFGNQPRPTATPENTAAQRTFGDIFAKTVGVLEHAKVCNTRVPQMVYQVIDLSLFNLNLS
jgi:hypothetical protein